MLLLTPKFCARLSSLETGAFELKLCHNDIVQHGLNLWSTAFLSVILPNITRLQHFEMKMKLPKSASWQMDI